MEPASRSVSSAGAVDVQQQRVCAPVARVCSPPSEKNCLVQSRLVLNEVSRSSVAQGTSPAQAGDAGRPISNLQESAGPKSGNPQPSCPLAGSSSSKEDLQFSSEVTSSNLSVNKISSSVSPERRQDASSSQELIAANIPEIPLDMIPLPSDKRPSPTSLSGKTSSAVKKRSSPVLQIPKSTSPDSEVSSLMAHETLPQSPSISSSVSKAGTVVLEGQAPALVDSNPCSARSPIPVVPSSLLQPNSGVSLPSFGSVFSPTKGGEPVPSEDSTAKNSSQIPEKPSQSTKQTSEPPAKKRKRKDKKAVGKAKGALSLLIQYDSDSQSSCGTHTESDDSSAHSTSPVSDTLSPVVMETTDPAQYQTSGAQPQQIHEVSANSGPQINGAIGSSPKSGEIITHKKRPSNGKTSVEKKKSKGGKKKGDAKNASPFVNLNDTVASMQQLKSVGTSVSVPATYQPYPSAYASYPPPGQHGYVMPGFSLPTSALNYTPGGHPHAQYATSLPQFYTGEAHPGPPGYSTSPRGYLPQWRTSYAPMQCQQPTFNYTNNGNNGSNVYR